MRSDAARRLEHFSRLRSQGLPVPAIARELGVSLSAAEHYAALYRAQVRDTVMDAPITWPVPAAPAPGVAHWSGRAACRGHEGLFYAPEGIESLRAKEVREAKARSLCAACPVRVQCGEQAEGDGEMWGVWAGVTEDDRENEKRQQREERVA
jgi:WhiB family redox-sensing transcriptional regulator